MKVYATFDHDRLVLVGAGIFPWLKRDHWIFGDHIEGVLIRFGVRRIIKLAPKELDLRYKEDRLHVMGNEVVASTTLKLQIYRWLSEWKNK